MVKQVAKDWKKRHAKSLKPAFNPSQVEEDFDKIMDELNGEYKAEGVGSLKKEDGGRYVLPNGTEVSIAASPNRVTIEVEVPQGPPENGEQLVETETATLVPSSSGGVTLKEKNETFRGSLGKDELDDVLGGLMGY